MDTKSSTLYIRGVYKMLNHDHNKDIEWIQYVKIDHSHVQIQSGSMSQYLDVDNNWN